MMAPLTRLTVYLLSCCILGAMAAEPESHGGLSDTHIAWIILGIFLTILLSVLLYKLSKLYHPRIRVVREEV